MTNQSSILPFKRIENCRSAVRFTRLELARILDVYGRMVAAGQWRDYAIGDNSDMAVFAIFARSRRRPLYRIVKEPRLAKARGAFALVGEFGEVIRRGSSLSAVLPSTARGTIRVVK